MSSWVNGQCAGENRKEESKGWNGNGSTGSTHDLAFFDILTAIHWDWSPGSVELFILILILWQYHLKYQTMPNNETNETRKKIRPGRRTGGFRDRYLRYLEIFTKTTTRLIKAEQRDHHQATTAHIGWSLQRCQWLRTMVTELSESSSDGFVASTCVFFSGVSVKSLDRFFEGSTSCLAFFWINIFFATLKRVDWDWKPGNFPVALRVLVVILLRSFSHGKDSPHSNSL